MVQLTAARNEALVAAMHGADYSETRLAKSAGITRMTLARMIAGQPVTERKARRVHTILGQPFNSLAVALYCPGRYMAEH